MRRFPPRDLPPRLPRDRIRREVPRREGPFDRILRPRLARDPAPFIIGGTVAFIAIVLIIVFALFGLLSDGGGGEKAFEQAGIKGRLNPDVPELPAGLVAVSGFYEFDVPEDKRDLVATIGIPLEERLAETASAAFYTFAADEWRRVGDVTLANDGLLAQGDFSPFPDNLAVLEVVSRAFQSIGSLPPNGTVHEGAQGLLDYVSPRDYRPAADGSVIGEATPLKLTPEQQLLPTVVATDSTSAVIVNDIISDADLTQTHIDEIVAMVESGKFAGIDLEYTGVDSDLGDQFADFVTALAQALHGVNAKLALTLPPAASDAQAEPYDWAALGQAADIVKVLPMPDPEEYRDTMPAALQYATEKVDRQKLFLVVSPYSTLRSAAGIEAIGYQQAMLVATEVQPRGTSDPEKIEPGAEVELAAKNIVEGGGASSLRWSDEAAAVTFTYAGVEERTVYVENEFSVPFKLELVKAFQLRGLAVADASAESDVPDVWPVVRGLLEGGSLTLLRPNSEALVPRWQAPTGGTLDVGTGAVATWVAPDEAGSYTVDLLVSDGAHLFGQHFTLKVEGEPVPVVTPPPTLPPEETPVPTRTVTPKPTKTATPKPTPTKTPKNPKPTPTVTRTASP
ncbi:MAG: hypothetical protein HYS09_09010 [Chloroflexi bacterium]|nr:hypothetical protein [Chloroflexota bacterium]